MMQDAFSRCHPILNFFYFLVVMGITMFMQHPVFLALSFVAAIFYAVWLEGWRKVLRMNLLFTLPGLLITSLLNPMFNHYGVTPLLYIESSGNWVTLEALIYGMVLGCVLFIIILWFSCYNQVMTTVEEFKKITQSMYDKGFVMVRLEDMAKKNADGVMEVQDIMLPPGKQPFVLSQDDVSYYHYMDGDGMASKLVLDENGEVKNEYIEDDGSISVGDYDMVPLIDSFVKEHPDFSYKGAKGILALTGYNGVLGYRTDMSYKTQPEDLNADKKQWLAEHPDFKLKKERAAAKKVAAAMKENGWEFASHTWGHLNVGEISMERLKTDTRKWKNNVERVVGKTDKIIFAFGADLAGVEGYGGNEKFEYLKKQGFDYYCNVDSSRYWVQITDQYLRQGRRNLDGYRMYYNPDMLADLFDASEVFDPARPTPVPEM